MYKSKSMRLLALFLTVFMVIGCLPFTVFAAQSKYDTSVSGEYFKVISENSYTLAPGAVEHEIVLNNASGDDRKVAHVIEVDPNNPEIQVLPGYYEIDKFDPEDTSTWKTAGVTVVADYYANTLGLNVVGAMNTALQYTNNAPYGFMVYNGEVLANNDLAKGADTYLAVTKNEDGTVEFELRSIEEALHGDEWQAVSANFGWLVKNGKLSATKVERTSSDASRSMLGIKADGTLVICQVDGRNAPVSTGLSNYEMGEMMLALGCVYAVNGDGGGSSSFVSKRPGTDNLVMRSVPSDGAERPTINSIIVVSTAGASGEFAEVMFETEYDYIAPGASMSVEMTGLDTKNFTMDIPADVTYRVNSGNIEDGVFTAGDETGTAFIEAVYEGEIVGTKELNVVHPETFGFAEDETVIPYGKTISLAIEAIYGADNWNVCVDGVYEFSLDDDNAAEINGNELTASDDESFEGVNVTVSYNSAADITDVLKVTYGKGSEIIFDFEDGETAGFMGFKDAKQWSKDNDVNNTLVGSDPLGGQFSPQVDGYTSIAEKGKTGQVKNGNYALAWTADYTDAEFAGWTYNVLFNVGDPVVLRDVENGKNATTLGMWLYIPEGAAGLAFQSQLYVKNADGSLSCKQDHFMFETVSGVRKNLNSCTEADIPANRWVYASIDISKYDYLQTPDPTDESNSRSPSIIRTYVKPVNPYVLTFYIDDITLDYSSAVDDRVLPKIANISYTTADEAVALNDAAVIPANSVAFSAEVSDNAVLNFETAQIYVDGNPVDTQVNNMVIATKESVVLENGLHTVTFEIADTLGNYAQESRIFSVENGEAKGLIYLEGHNDSGEMPEYDSVYYVDIKTTDISKVQTLEANIKLNSANTWELEQMMVAEGFKVIDCEVMESDNSITTFAANTDIHSTDNVAIITLEKTDECTLTGEQTLVSMPVRLWSWSGFDQVTGKPVTPEEQFKSGYCPVVKVDYEVLFGYAETADGEVIPFNGSASVDTMINDTVNPWHYHDTELTVLNQDATCLVNGYANRTYCETCKSVIDWGTVVPAAGHTYEVVDDQLVCACGTVLGGNGLVTANDKIYCLIADKLVTGWQNVDNKWVYAAKSDKEVQTGEFTVNKLTYTADEDGYVIKGAWVTDENGTKYSYGPAFYNREWMEIEGVTYYFGTDSYIYTGIQYIPVNRNNMKEGIIWYEFAEDGAYIGKVNGFVDYNNLKYYVVDGVFTYGGLILIDGDYYYARTSGEIVCNKKYYITKNNDLLPVASYEFGADGKMINPPVEEEPGETPDNPEIPEVKNGIVDENGMKYWYVDGEKTYGGLMLIDGDYYYARTSGEIVCNRKYYITKNNDLLPVASYEFGADGKMINPPSEEEPDDPEIPEEPAGKNGIVEEGGKLYWYVDDAKTYGGLMLIDGDYYYARTSGEIVCNRKYYITKNNDLLPVASYEFGADGKMINPPSEEEPDDPEIPEEPEEKNGIVEEGGKLYWYVDDAKTYGGLMLIDGDYYYARTSGEIVCSRKYYITKNNDLLPVASYEFGADGKMINPPVN